MAGHETEQMVPGQTPFQVRIPYVRFRAAVELQELPALSLIGTLYTMYTMAVLPLRLSDDDIKALDYLGQRGTVQES